MISCGVCSWTLVGLVGAFIDLALAYLLLCVSAFVFCASRFWSAFGFHLPCPCKGVLGFRSSSFCLHKLLVEMPARKIYSVQSSVRSRYPFGLVVHADDSRNSNLKLARDKKIENGFIELSSEKLGSSSIGAVLQNLNDREVAPDVKGKGIIVNQKLRPGLGIRRRRSRAALGYGKFRPTNNLKSAVGGVCPYPPGNGEMRSQIAESLGPGSGINDRILDERKPSDISEVERTWHSYELSGFFEGSKGANLDSDSVDKYTTDVPDKLGIESKRIRMLEQELAKEKAACVALHLELEKERAASATAADEAMAMIFRLQEEKASIEMEVRQNERLMEEKFSYDEEEMSILKEILIRREKEHFFLENEVEAYRQISSGDKKGDNHVQDIKGSHRKSPPVLHPGECIQSVVPEINNDGVISDYIMEPTQHCASMKKYFPHDEDVGEECRENGDNEGCNLQESVDDMQQIVHDVHVVDDKAEQPRDGTSEEEMGQNGHTSYTSIDGALESLVNSRSRTVIHDSGRGSLLEVHNVDIEVEWLREMLRIVQEGKEKLRTSGKNREGETSQLELLDTIQHELQEIQRVRGLMRHASSPNVLSKVEVEEK